MGKQTKIEPRVDIYELSSWLSVKGEEEEEDGMRGCAGASDVQRAAPHGEIGGDGRRVTLRGS